MLAVEGLQVVNEVTRNVKLVCSAFLWGVKSISVVLCGLLLWCKHGFIARADLRSVQISVCRSQEIHGWFNSL